MKKDYGAIKSKVMKIKIKSYETSTGHFRESFVLCARFRGNMMSCLKWIRRHNCFSMYHLANGI